LVVLYRLFLRFDTLYPGGEKQSFGMYWAPAATDKLLKRKETKKHGGCASFGTVEDLEGGRGPQYPAGHLLLLYSSGFMWLPSNSH
jgi:hypothetical protein